MKGDSGNMKQYSATDISLYLEGKMTDMEMHAIEKAALEDPFLADAIEGYSEAIVEHGMDSVETSASNLQKEFTERIKEKKRLKVVPFVRMKWWQAAAAALIIGTAGTLGYLSYSDRADALLLTVNETGEKAEFESKVTDSAAPRISTINPDSVTTSPETATIAENGQASKVITKRSDSTPVNENKKDPGTGTPASDMAVAPASVKRQAAPALPLQKAEDYELDKNAVANIQADSLSIHPPAQLETKLSGKVAGIAFESRNATITDRSINYFNGQIVTSDNKPLSNAVLKLNNNEKIYTTDNNGKFRIASADTVIEVEASMVGRETTRFRIQKNDETNQLILPDATNDLSEVVVMGYGKKRKRELTGSVTVVRRQAEPEGGWLELEKYLEANKDSTLNLNGTAETELSFQVNAKTNLSQFRLIRSISAKHDREVIRLIKEGPKWKLLKGKKATVTITVKF
jgi:hypothetical protein